MHGLSPKYCDLVDRLRRAALQLLSHSCMQAPLHLVASRSGITQLSLNSNVTLMCRYVSSTWSATTSSSHMQRTCSTQTLIQTILSSHPLDSGLRHVQSSAGVPEMQCWNHLHGACTLQGRLAVQAHAGEQLRRRPGCTCISFKRVNIITGCSALLCLSLVQPAEHAMSR